MKHQRDHVRGADEVGGRSFSGNGGEVAASDPNQGQGSLLRRVAVFGAAGAIFIGLFGLLGYVPGLRLLGSVREGYIPMAPSTAISFIVLGGILLAMALRSPSRASLVLLGVLAALVALFGALEVAGHFTGRDLNFEDALVPAAGHLGEIPIARMSPSTGASFFLAGLAAFALLLRVRTRGRETRVGHWGGSLGFLVFGAGLVFCLAYVYGSPLLYGRGATVPMALTTALAFLLLGAATVGVAGEDAIPVRLLAGGMRAGKPMNARRRFLVLALIMITACGVGLAIITIMLYRHNIQEYRDHLQTAAQSQARLIEAMARHDSVYERNTPGGPTEATLSQIVDAHEHYEGIGETGEFTLARREGDSIVFLLRHRHKSIEHPESIPFDTELAEPMRLALGGLSGTIIGLDYRGETVLAAHEPVAELNLGIVAKVDLAEIRAPFIASGLAAAAFALLVVLAGTALFFRIGNPIIARLEAYSQNLEKEVEQRTKELRDAQEELVRRERLAVLGTLAGSVGHELRNPLGVISNAIYYLNLTHTEADEKTREYLGIISSEVGNAERIVVDLLDFSRAKIAEREGVAVSDLVGRVLEKQGLPEEIQVATEFAADLPAVFVDSRQIEQVLTNLVSNACQAMPEGGQLAIRVAGENGRVRLTVSDTGCGMSPETLEKVFEPLFTTRARGIGLGLSVTRDLVEINGGSITVESREGQGSAFSVILPTQEVTS